MSAKKKTKCDTCKKEYEYYPSAHAGKFCSLECRRHTEETKEKISEASKGFHHSPETEFEKGHVPWNKGKTKWEDKRLAVSKETRKRMSKASKRKWNDPSYRKKVMGKRGVSSLENRVYKVIKENELPYKFVGNGGFSIGRKIPDFISTNGKKVAVEVYSRRHKEQFRGGLERWEKDRRKRFKDRGWDTIFIPEYKTNKKDDIINLLRGGD